MRDRTLMTRKNSPTTTTIITMLMVIPALL